MSAQRPDPTILLVLPDRRESAAAVDALIGAGCQVVLVEDGEAAFAHLLAHEGFACVVVDAALSTLAPSVLLKRMRSYLRLQRVPIVLVGETTDDAALDVRGRIQKPVDPTALVGAVKAAIAAPITWPPRRARSEA